MNKDNDNLESLEQELKELQKKKLKKEIIKLEKELNIASKITPVQKKQNHRQPQKQRPNLKVTKHFLLYFLCYL